jgi:amino acid transporter
MHDLTHEIYLAEAPMPADAAALRPGRELRRSLSTFGVLLLALSCLSPVFSIYGVGADVLQHAGSAAAGLFALGIGAALVYGVVYAELGSAYPYSGGDYVGVGAILGPGAGFVALALWTVMSGPSAAFEAQVLATYVGDLMPGVPAAAITFVCLAAAALIALLAVRTSALITGLFLAVEMLAVLILIVCGFSQPLHGLASTMQAPVALPAGALAGAALVPVTLAAMASAAISAIYGTVGGNQAIGFGEELIDPHRRMGRTVILACMIGATATAIPVIAMVLGARDLAVLLQSPAPFTAFVASVAGRGVGRAIDAGVSLAIFNALIAQIMWCARLFFSLGRDQVLIGGANRLLARVDEPSGAPRAATLVVGVYTALCCLVSAHVLLVFLAGGMVYTYGLVCTAVLRGRARGLTALPGYWRSWLFPLAPVLGLAMVAAFALADLTDPDAGRPSVVIMGAVSVAAALWYTLRLKRRPGGWAPICSADDKPADFATPGA